MHPSVSRSTRIALVLAAVGACACTATSTTSNRSTTMPEHNKKAVEELFESCFNQGQLHVLDRLLSPDYVGAQGEIGPESFKRTVLGLRTAFPDIHYAVNDVVAEGDKVAVRWRWSGTHKGSFRAFAPTGRSMTNTGTAIFQLRDGKIVGAALETDRLGFLQQMDVVPPDAVLLKPRQ
jgi:predicted ester cyclase